MQLITNCSPVDILTALFGRSATFRTVNLATTPWVELGLRGEVHLAWRGNGAAVVRPLQTMGINIKPVQDLSLISQMVYGDSVILIDPSTGRAFSWMICA